MKTVIISMFLMSLALMVGSLWLELKPWFHVMNGSFVGFMLALVIFFLPGKAALDKHMTKIEKLEDDLRSR